MINRYDYKVYIDNAGTAYLFIRDFGKGYTPSEAPELFAFRCDEGREEAAKYLAEIMSSPDEICLDDWHISNFDLTGYDAQALVDELAAWEAEGNGGARLTMEGDIYA